MDSIINYINKGCFKNQFLIAADDTPLNILAFQFSNNYSNINIPGYLYNLREGGMSHDSKRNIEHDIILSYNYLLYLKLLYQYIIDYNKDMNFFFYEFDLFSMYLQRLKDLNIKKYSPMLINFCQELRKRNIPTKYSKIINELLNGFWNNRAIINTIMFMCFFIIININKTEQKISKNEKESPYFI